MIPVLTVIGLDVGYLLGGSVVTEMVFKLAGAGAGGRQRHLPAGQPGHHRDAGVRGRALRARQPRGRRALRGPEPADTVRLMLPSTVRPARAPLQANRFWRAFFGTSWGCWDSSSSSSQLGCNLRTGGWPHTTRSLYIGLVAEGVALAIGIVLGSMAGYLGGWVDDLIMRLTDIFFAIPSLLFLIVVVFLFDSSASTIFIALGLISWPSEARLMRSEVPRLRDREFVTAAGALGGRSWRVIARHILPTPSPR
jgi:ABC-type dipeptide/oligopeptide/nickel transport system permease subunit